MAIPLLLCGVGLLFAMCAACFYRMGAADCVDEKKFLIDSLESLASENAKLREELDDQASYDQILSDILCQQTELCIKAEADNAKLWELSSIMLKCIMANERKKLICWECPMHKQFDELRSYCCLEQEAKKLGIEE